MRGEENQPLENKTSWYFKDKVSEVFFRLLFGKAPRHILDFRSSFIEFTWIPEVTTLMNKSFPESPVGIPCRRLWRQC